jgi:diadenosine tetraphosphate (Ap4A) HIT family hydrolase
VNPTAEKFGYPDSLVASFDHWHVLVRPAQPTLGSLVLVCSDPISGFGEMSAEAGADLSRATEAIEKALGALFQYDKINYLMLMMVDPDVHFHVLPRYQESREYAGHVYHDTSWPGPPDITASQEFPDSVKQQLIRDLESRLR